MALFTARQARSRTTTMSCLKSKDQQMYMYLYILGVALLLVISVSLLQLGLTRVPPDFPVHYDPRHARKGASEDLRVLHHRHTGENFKPGETPSRRRRPPVMNSRNRSKGWKVEKEKEAEEETRTQEVNDLSDFEGRDIEEEIGENSRIYQGQQLDDMDQFGREEAKEDSDVDKSDHANGHDTVGDDSVPQFVEDLSRSRKFQPNRPESRDSEKIDDSVVKIQALEEKIGSVMAAIEQEMAKTKTGRDSLRRSLGETTDVREEGSSSGMAPPREFLDDGNKSSLHTDENPVKGEDAGDDVQTTVKDVVVHSLHVEANDEQSSRSRLEINNLDSMNALTTSMNASALVEDSKAQEHLESADDVVQTEKQVIKEENEGEKKLNNLGGVAEGNGVEEQVEVNKTGSAVKEGRGKNDGTKEGEEDDDHDNKIQWGFYPTLGSTLKFSKFLSSFFKQENCSLRIFMAWTTAPWAYTPRHQRAIESILYFHPQACIVVFTETIDFQFFDSWVKEGYKIAVARPNLEELLGQTPAIDFAYVWYEWRSMNLFYIHYTDLLRIAALHKYGGVWLDMDMILARPLPQLHNVLASTVAEDGEWVLNGAFMAFDRSSSFLKACIEEFVATYDERLVGWNGADLLNRVASNATRKGGKVWLERSEHLQVLEPIAFFPLSRHNIIKYFSAPRRNRERVQQKKMLSAILNESHGTHLWNSVTGRLVPEVGSLVEQLLNRYCMRCTAWATLRLNPVAAAPAPSSPPPATKPLHNPH